MTIGDYAAQALIGKLLLLNSFPEDGLIAEESSKGLEHDPVLAEEIVQVFHKCGVEHVISSIEELKECIDLGQSYNPSTGQVLKDEVSQRKWCLDPIDGTRGFLRGKKDGGQYCIALALIEDGIPIVGLLACPNLPTSPSEQDSFAWGTEETMENWLEHRGCIFVASKGGGCFQLPLFPPANQADSSTEGAIRVSCTTSVKEEEDESSSSSVGRSISQGRFCTGVESYSDALGETNAMALKIHGSLKDNGDILYRRRMDSQVKYGILARGEAEYMTRLPKKEYVEWIWDHAAGRVVIEEAGGVQTDTRGELIDYGLGAKMDPNVNGILVSAGGEFHEALVRSYREQAEERENASTSSSDS